MTAAPATLVVGRHEISDLMAPGDWLGAVEAGFRAAAEGRAAAPPPMHIHGEGGAFHAKGASLRLDRLYVALKLNGNFPANPDRLGLPTIQGAILLCDGANGRLLAVIDSIEVTLRRTAAATALAAQLLARPGSATVLVCGCGRQGAAQLEAVREVLPLQRCLAWDRDKTRAQRFARKMDAEPVDDLTEAAMASDVILCCTTATSPYLRQDMVRPGTFIAAVGADSPDKSEVDPALMRESAIVADVLGQCRLMGDLHHAIAAGLATAGGVRAELAQVLLGTADGRRSQEEIVLFDSTGTAVQDVAACIRIYERARERGSSLSLGLAA